jgi:hypothetical protein
VVVGIGGVGMNGLLGGWKLLERCFGSHTVISYLLRAGWCGVCSSPPGREVIFCGSVFPL